jgi:hypothetical protein
MAVQGGVPEMWTSFQNSPIEPKYGQSVGFQDFETRVKIACFVSHPRCKEGRWSSLQVERPLHEVERPGQLMSMSICLCLCLCLCTYVYVYVYACESPCLCLRLNTYDLWKRIVTLYGMSWSRGGACMQSYENWTKPEDKLPDWLVKLYDDVPVTEKDPKKRKDLQDEIVKAVKHQQFHSPNPTSHMSSHIYIYIYIYISSSKRG